MDNNETSTPEVTEVVETKKVTPEDIERLRSQDWYKLLVEDLQSMITETQFGAREMIITLWHNTGKRLAENRENFKAEGVRMEVGVAAIAKDMNKSVSTIWKALQFYDWLPEDDYWDKLPEGKAISWSKITSKYLPTPKEQKAKDEAEAKKAAIPVAPEITLTWNPTLQKYTLMIRTEDFDLIDFNEIKEDLREKLALLD